MSDNSNKIVSISYGTFFKKVLYITGIALMVLMMLFSIFYLSHSYAALSHWYYSLNACFYKRDVWPQQFFTPDVKAMGNQLATAAMLLAASGIMFIIRNWRMHPPVYDHRHFKINTTGWGWYVAVAAIAITAGSWEWHMMPPAYDEIFSAVNCAELHPFQTLSYYMLPNNHILFNLVNRFALGWCGDLVSSGRIISLLAYTGVLMCAFHWLARITGNRLHAFVLVLPIAMQFTTWGMGAMARGYEAQLLCGWLALLSLARYIRNDYKGSPGINTLCNLAGFALIPSWFYFYAAQLLFMAGYMIVSSRIGIRYIKHQLLMAIAIFLFYMPAFCFSGIHAFAENKYVRPETTPLSLFMPDLLSRGSDFIGYCFSYIAAAGRVLSYLLFVSPLLLLFTKRREHRLIAGFYVSLWLSYFLVSLVIKHLPFHRTLIVQFSLTMAFVAYTLYAVVDLVSQKLRNRQVAMAATIGLFVLPILAYTAYLARYNRNNINFGLYANDVNGIYNAHIADIRLIPPGSSIAFSMESFYFFYHCRKLHYDSGRCPNYDEDYYIKRIDEPLPTPMLQDYILMAKGGEDYEIYKRK